MKFDHAYKKWIEELNANEKNPRRRERIANGLGFSSIEFLREVWFPVVGNFNFLQPEWEVRDLNSGFRYLDFAYMPGGVKGGIEIQGYGPHARNLDTTRFKDLCMRQSYLTLEGWSILPVAYLSIRDDTKQCQQLILAFIGHFMSSSIDEEVTWLEAEIIRYSRRILRPITPLDIAKHLKISDRYSRILLKKMVEKGYLIVASGKDRARSYSLK